VRSRDLQVAAIAALIATAAGCGGGGEQHASPSPTAAPTSTPAARQAAPRPLGECRSAGGGWESLPTSGRYSPDAARLGDGRLGVVFANDSDNDSCAWSAEARSLARHRYAVAVFETIGGAGFEAQQVAAVARALRRTGVRRVAVIGASVGARAVLQVAAERPRDVAGVVALSAERRITSNPADLLPVGKRVRAPVLTIGSREDPLTSFGKDTLAWHRAIPDDHALVVGGSGHGVELLMDRHRRRVRSAILAHLRDIRR